ncbi:hypothetical protein D3C71_1262570 [compost metagenome]
MDGLRHMREQGLHLLGALQIQLIRSDAEALLVVYRLARADADQHVLNLRILPGQIMRIVRNRQGNAGLLGQRDQLRIDTLLLGNAVVLKLQIEILAENLLVPKRRQLRLRIPPVKQMLRNFAAETGAETDQAFRMGRKGFHVNPRLVVVAFQMSD